MASHIGLDTPRLKHIRWGRIAAASIVTIFVALSVLKTKAVVPRPPSPGFHHPKRVTIQGYVGDAMEPFITKDGKYLLFNNSNSTSVNTNLYSATRVDDLTFDFKGELTGVNTDALEGVPSLDRNGNLYFVSPRTYGSTFSTIYRGKFHDGKVTNVQIAPGVSLKQPGIVNFDAEISADGNTLYVVDGDFSRDPKPYSADIEIAMRIGDAFQRDPKSDQIMRNVNSSALEYAPCIASDGLELFFTRVDKITAHAMPAIYRATRKNTKLPFDLPQQVGAITGFVEGPTLNVTGHILYYHKRENGKFVIYCVTR